MMASFKSLAAALMLVGSASAATMYETVMSTGNHNTFIALVDAVPDLAYVLKRQGVRAEFHTVFAPNDDAFLNFANDIGLTMEPYKVQMIENFLKYHIVAGTKLAADITFQEMIDDTYEPGDVSDLENGMIATLLGTSFTYNEGTLAGYGDTMGTITESVECDGGVIHVMDGALLPPMITELAAVSAPEFSTLLELIEKVDLSDQFTNYNSQKTVFAPTNAAFEKFFETLGMTKEDIIGTTDDELIQKMQLVIMYHLSEPIDVFTLDVVNGSVFSIAMLTGDALNFAGEYDVDGQLVISMVGWNTGNIITADLGCLNGVVHVVDEVLLSEYNAKQLCLFPGSCEETPPPPPSEETEDPLSCADDCAEHEFPDCDDFQEWIDSGCLIDCMDNPPAKEAIGQYYNAALECGDVDEVMDKLAAAAESPAAAVSAFLAIAIAALFY